LTGQKQVLELLARGVPLADVLASLVRLIEDQSEGILGSVLVRRLGEDTFYLGVGPSLPESYVAVLAQAPTVPPYLGPCGRAAHLGEDVATPDIGSDERWPEEWRQVASEIGLRTCYSAPIFASDGTVLGSFAAYRREYRDPEALDRQLLEMATHLAGIAIERKAAEEEIRRLNAELERRVVERTAQLEETNRELEMFAYSVSHDLRAPLRGIDGFSRVLADDYNEVLDETAQSYLQRIRDGAGRMAKLIDDLLDLSRMSRSRMRREQVDLSALARNVVERLRGREPERTVDAVIQEGLTASGDHGLLEIVLENLLGNAWKFTRDADSCRVECGSTQADGERVYFVRDNGAGFDMRYADKLFSAFQRLHSPADFEGTGIGLAIVQRIVHRHGGRVWAEAEVGTGAAFHFTLPHE
jgi:signal transduction histidine kinase